MNPAHELAAEVYTKAMRTVRRRFGRHPKHSQVVHDAVGEAFVRWYKSSSDKTAHSANEHARWMASTAGSHILDTDPCRRKPSRAVRSIASHGEVEEHDEQRAVIRREAQLRRFIGAPEFAYAEDNLNEALDAVRGRHAVPDATVHQEALATLKRRGWTDACIADATGVSRPTVGTWRSGREPSPTAGATLLHLADSRAKAPRIGRTLTRFA